ncbi:unnamed protein product [Mucor hiemalis]
MDYSSQDISVTCLFVASKVEETTKKLKDVLVAVHSVKHPDSKELDPELISEDRKRKFIGFEKMLLETVCFDFQLRHPFEYIIKFVKWIQVFQGSLDSKPLAKKAYQLAVDSYKTVLSVEYPAHTIAGGCIYLASRLLREQNSAFNGLAENAPWDQYFLSRMEDIEDVAQQILDLYIYTNSSAKNDLSLYTTIKISLNEQAQARGPDPVMDEITQQEMKARIPDWEFNTSSSTPLEAVNTNHHTASYHFSSS